MGKWRTLKWGRRRKRFQGLLQVAILLAGSVTFVTVCLLTNRDSLNSAPHYNVHKRSLLQSTEDDLTIEEGSGTEQPEEGNVTKSAPLFPPDIFTIEQLRQGAIILHVLGMVYMFVALAIVCDEFFVPSLDVIIEKADISADVAGATFMAAGGSAPELFTSVIGVFISFDDVGIGTIVGSAVFNILFVIAMCVLFSKTVLDLTWWPIFRDCTFYSIALIMMVIFFLDTKIYWYEAMALFCVYLCYCGFMKINHPFERFVKRHLNKNKHQGAAQSLHGGPQAAAPKQNMRRPSIPMLHSGTKFRQGLLQLMIHTIDPLHDGKVDEKATQLHAIASLKVLLDATKPQNGRVETYKTDGLSPVPDAQSHLSGRSSQGTAVTQLDSVISGESQQLAGGIGTGYPPTSNGDLQSESSMGNNVSYENAIMAGAQEGFDGNTVDPALSDIPEVNVVPNAGMLTDVAEEEEEEEIKPIDLSWPDTCWKRITYLCVMPLIIPMWLTLPDTRTPRGKRFFPIAFFGSIVWIAIFSYLMVWWATVVGQTINIPPEVMGLTILAAGTSVPDLITSVIVARKGFGDMAVSSSIGSNIFDVCVGLPVPWMLFALVGVVKNFINDRPDPWTVDPISVGAAGMACSIMLLFTMLMFVLVSIICSRWKMNKGLGISMFFLYFVFVAVSLSFEYDILECII